MENPRGARETYVKSDAISDLDLDQSRRSFLERMALVGLLAVPVIGSAAWRHYTLKNLRPLKNQYLAELREILADDTKTLEALLRDGTLVTDEQLEKIDHDIERGTKYFAEDSSPEGQATMKSISHCRELLELLRKARREHVLR